MKQSDIGPFGVLALVFVVLGQVAALAQLYGDSWGAVRSGRSSRGRCSVGADSRRPGGCLRHGPRGWGRRLRGGAGALRGGAGGGGCGRGRGVGWGLGVYGVVPAVVVALVVAELLLRHCRRRFGGVTGDVFGGLRRLRRLLRSWCFRWVGECGGQPAPLSGLPSRVFDRNRVLSRGRRHAPRSYFFSEELSFRWRELARKRVVGSSYSTWRTALFALTKGVVLQSGRAAIRGWPSQAPVGGADGRPGPGASSGSAWRRTSAVAPGASRPRTSSPSAARTAARVLQPCALRACRPSPSDPRCGRFAEDPWKSCRSMSMSPT